MDWTKAQSLACDGIKNVGNASVNAAKMIRYGAAVYGPEIISNIAGKSEFSPSSSGFSETYSFQERRNIYQSYLETHPNHVPVVIERAYGCTKSLGSTSKSTHIKLVISRSTTVSQIRTIIAKRINLDATESIFLCVTGTTIMPMQGLQIGAVYDQYASRDGLLYLVFRDEKVFG